MPTPIPSQPHPDVAIAKNVLKELKPGEILPYETAAKALGVNPKSPVFHRRFASARRALVRPEEGGIAIVCVPGEGFLREHSSQSKSRIEGREMKSIGRKATRSMQVLNTIDVKALENNERAEVFGLAACLAAVKISVGKPARQKLIAAATATQAEIATRKALEILQGNGEK